MSSKNADNQESLISASPSDEVNLYDYWKILVKWKNIFLGILLITLVLVTIVSLIMPRYYRGESEISIPVPVSNTSSVITAPNIVNLVGNIDDIKKNKIFPNNSGAIKSVIISIPKKSTDKVSIIIDAKTVDIIPQALNDVCDYIINIPEIKDKIDKINVETDFKIQKLTEAKKANLIFLNQITDMMMKKQITLVNVNPADLIKKDAEISLEIKNLEQAKSDAMKKKELNINGSTGILGRPSITKQPSDLQIKQRIIIIGVLSLFVGIYILFILVYIERMKARKNKSTALE